MKKICKNCKHYHLYTTIDYDNGFDGQCRINPPEAEAMYSWPEVKDDDWCGKFEFIEEETFED